MSGGATCLLKVWGNTRGHASVSARDGKVILSVTEQGLVAQRELDPDGAEELAEVLKAAAQAARIPKKRKSKGGEKVERWEERGMRKG